MGTQVVRKMRSREPEVRIDIDAMNLIANIQAQTYYSNAIEARGRLRHTC